MLFKMLVISFIGLFLSCSLDYKDQVIISKSKAMNDECTFTASKNENAISGSYFTAPCDCYEIGDSLNKYYTATHHGKK